MKFQKIKYSDLNAKAQEMYNFQKIAALLANYGYTSMWLNNDQNGADFIAVHLDGVSDIKVQLKGRLSFAKRYKGKNLYIGLIANESVYLYPHDEVIFKVESKISDNTWIEKV